ncbi:hypothetical protein FXV77_05500 [Sphingobacterium phlebotomi]|uniref:Uncharacterized protein n=1 Tax=Sphingobacterium phlebotomi TaxID=2605433 RepID=A0A5D4HF47_9SPHI|nr:hypothetical protein [Sphingobacterium phlebotomi]TYR37460.1 hypothetical protein FXV77_05500 [Sphingobacterium phlebotomi]
MAEREKVEELISYLSSLGFEGAMFEANIRQEYKKKLPVFTVRHRVTLGDEAIQYNLRFTYEKMFDAYRLASYKAIYRDPLVIEHGMFSGIDTELLEEKMKVVDWREYFSNPSTQQTGTLPNGCQLNVGDMREMQKMVFQLGNQSDYIGQEISKKLMFKYWSEEFWQDECIELQKEYGRTLDFEMTENGIANATLALNMVSGTFDDLYRQLARTGLEQYFDVDLKKLLMPHLSKDDDGFELTCMIKIKSGIISCRIPVSKLEEGFNANTNHVEFIRYPTVSYNIYDGISTYELESKMKDVDWEDKYECTMHLSENWELTTYIQDIKDDIDRLRAYGATHWADYLQIRYWSQTFMEVFITDETWKMEEWTRYQLPFKIDEDIRAIINLLTGSPVHTTALKSFDVGCEGWFMLDSRKVTEKGVRQISLVKGLTKSKLETMLKMLPLDGQMEIDKTVEGVMRGDCVTVPIESMDEIQSVVVSANPRAKKIDVHTENGKSIPINFSLAPDWDSQKPISEQSVEKKVVLGRGRKM